MNIMQPGKFSFSNDISFENFNIKLDIDNQFVDEKSFLVSKYDNYEDEQGKR